MKQSIKLKNIHTLSVVDGLLPISEGDYSSLKEDIKNNGIDIPVILNKNNYLLDGYLRFQISQELNLVEIPIIIKNISENDEESIKKFYLEKNFNRRHLSKNERAEFTYNLYEKLNYEGQNVLSENKNFDRAKYISDLLGISDRTVKRDIEKIRVKKGIKEEKVKARPYMRNYQLTDNYMISESLEVEENIIIQNAFKQKVELDKIWCVELTHFNQKHENPDMRFFKEGEYPTLTCQSQLFHTNGKEFSLREYSRIQTFNKNFILHSNRKICIEQLGNAVPPKMSEFIINKYIKKENKTFIDLFCGLGGFSKGAEDAGKTPKLGIDFNNDAILVYKNNFPFSKTICKDIKEIDEIELSKKYNIDFIIGSPSCKGFSQANSKKKDKLSLKENPENFLYLDFLRIVKTMNPNQFILENVENMTKFKEEIIEDFKKIGYELNFEIIYGPDAGMYQKRRRLFVIGNKIQ